MLRGAVRVSLALRPTLRNQASSLVGVAPMCGGLPDAGGGRQAQVAGLGGQGGFDPPAGGGSAFGAEGFHQLGHSATPRAGLCAARGPSLL